MTLQILEVYECTEGEDTGNIVREKLGRVKLSI